MSTVRITTAEALVRYLVAQRIVVDGVHRFVSLADPNAEPPADDSDSDVMDIGTA